MTFAISARCPRTGKLGVAISTRPLAVGARCPFIAPGIGIVVSMAATDPRLGLLGRRLLTVGLSAQQVLDRIVAHDTQIEYRQISVIDHAGNALARTGAANRDWAGAFCEPNMVAMGNGLVTVHTAEAMRDSYHASAGQALEDRLMAALEAGRDAGGQHGGQHSAALLVYGEEDYPLVDLRVDEHAEPIGELRRVFEIYRPQIDYFVLRASSPHTMGRVDEWLAKRQDGQGGAQGK